jgi:hypothetical protein
MVHDHEMRLDRLVLRSGILGALVIKFDDFAFLDCAVQDVENLELLRARGVTVLADVAFSTMLTSQRARFSVSSLNSCNCNANNVNLLRSPIFLLLMLLRSTTRYHLMTSPSAK